MAESINISIQNKDAAGKSVWTGYKNFADITNMNVSDLAPGSRNTFIQDGDRLEPRAGIDYFGVAGTPGNTVDPYWCIAHRIHSKHDEFVNVQGVKMPFRVFYSGTSVKGDVIEVWLPEYIAGVEQTTKRWYQITADAPTNVALSTHRYYWAEWWDSLNTQSHVVFTFGDNEIWNYTGGFSNVPPGSITATTIQLPGGVTWREKGFIDSPEGNNIIIVNGIEYIVTLGFGTDTITMASTAGISVDDIIFQSPDSNSTITGTTYDVCAMVNNQVYYIDWNQRNVYVSWDKNQNAFLGIQTGNSVSGLDDGVFSGIYTGTPLGQGNGTYIVTIDSVTPAVNEPLFHSNGGTEGGSFIDSAGYVGAGDNTYKVLVIANMIITFVAGVPVFTNGEIAIGGTSGAVLRIVVGGNLAGGALYAQTISGTPIPGEVLTGQTSGSARTILGGGVQFFSAAYVYKNNVLIPGLIGAIDDAIQLVLVGPQTLVDGLLFQLNDVGNNTAGDYWELHINSGSPDTFKWSFNGVNQAILTPITGAAQALSFGIDITFGATTGHAIGDSWTIIAYAAITRGWTQFFFSTPERLSGQGARLLLDSNGWAMKPQEKTMYINADAGHYYTVYRVLAANQLTEILRVERLKSEAQNKVLYPYLLNYERNQIAGISQDKSYDSLGRQEFIELPQTKSISDEIRVDFETSDWEDGDFMYAKRKMFFLAPRDGNMFVYDEYKKYWHSPMVFAKRIGLVSVIDGVLVGHSYEQNESYELFTGTSDLELYGIETKMVFPYDSFGKRFFQKSSSAIGFEGYIQGAPEIFYKMNADVGGCNGAAEGQILPVVCLPQDRASLGKSYLGYHGLGNDPVEVIPHFFFIDTFEKLNYYQRNMELTCDSLDQRWSIVSIGTNVDLSSENNTTIVHRKQV